MRNDLIAKINLSEGKKDIGNVISKCLSFILCVLPRIEQ